MQKIAVGGWSYIHWRSHVKAYRTALNPDPQRIPVMLFDVFLLPLSFTKHFICYFIYSNRFVCVCKLEDIRQNRRCPWNWDKILKHLKHWSQCTPTHMTGVSLMHKEVRLLEWLVKVFLQGRVRYLLNIIKAKVSPKIKVSPNISFWEILS